MLKEGIADKEYLKRVKGIIENFRTYLHVPGQKKSVWYKISYANSEFILSVLKIKTKELLR